MIALTRRQLLAAGAVVPLAPGLTAQQAPPAPAAPAGLAQSAAQAGYSPSWPLSPA